MRLEAGVTTVRGVGGLDVGFKLAVEVGGAIFVAGAIVTNSGRRPSAPATDAVVALATRDADSQQAPKRERGNRYLNRSIPADTFTVHGCAAVIQRDLDLSATSGSVLKG